MDQGDPSKLEEAKRALTRHTRRVGVFGKILLAALIIEVFLPLIFGEDTWWPETAIGVACAIAVAIGVWGENHFGEKANEAAGELKNEADRQIAAALKQGAEAHERAALAEERAAEANAVAEGERLKREELEARRANRRLTPEQYNRIVSRLSGLPTVKVGVIRNAQGGLETVAFAADLIDALEEAGWTVAEAIRTDLRDRTGFWVELVGGASNDEQRAAPELRATLDAVGILGDRRVGHVGDVGDASNARILLHIGEHPRGY